MSDYATNSKNGLFKEYNGSNRISMDDFRIIGNIMYKKNMQNTKTSEKEMQFLIQELRDTIDNQREEIEGLNNIINELEKYLIEMSDRSWDDNGAYDDVLDKLKALKENNK